MYIGDEFSKVDEMLDGFKVDTFPNVDLIYPKAIP
jgi:hypothetical protein